MEPARATVAIGGVLKMEKNPSSKLIEDQATILVASDNSSDAVLVKDILTKEFDQIFISTNQDKAAEDFGSRTPNVLILAFNALEKSERYYLGLYRQSQHIHAQAHRTIVLCRKEEVQSAYQACRKGHFDDYILFWPVTNDAPRLLMSVHHALRDLAADRNQDPSAAEFAAQARGLVKLGDMLGRQATSGNEQIEIVNRAIAYGADSVTFRPNSSMCGNSITGDGDLSPVTVQTARLGDLARERGFNRFTLICDIEGVEYDLVFQEPEVLQSADTIIMETHDRFIGAEKSRLMMDKLAGLGFKLVEENEFVVVLRQ